MPALTLQHLPESLYQQLKNAADLHGRSIDSEIIICLEKLCLEQTVTTAGKITPAERLSRIRQLRSGIKTNSITPEDIELAINSGRP